MLPILAALGAAGSADAQELAKAKDAGYVGERYDGLLAIVEASEAPQSAIDLVADINARRREIFEGLSKKYKGDAAALGSKTGAKNIERLAPGQYYLEEEGGAWKQKK